MSKALRATGAAIAGIALGLVGITVFAGAASATVTPPLTCDSTTTVPVTTHLVNRADFGHGKPEGSPWALLTIDRTVTIKKVEAAPLTMATVGIWSYQAVVTDNGTLVTKGGEKLSPNKGEPLVAGVNGKVNGTFIVDFTAPKCFGGYEGKQPSQDTKTGVWVKTVWGGEGFTTADPAHNYSWTYTTCSESWLDAYNNEDGLAEGAGDITGKACPSVAPVVTPSATASHVAVVPVAQPSLPVTGVNIPVIISTGIIVLAIGGFALFFTRRRKTN